MTDYSQNTKLLAISPMIFDLQASYLEYMYKTVRDSVNSDLVKRSRSQINFKRFGFSGAVFITAFCDSFGRCPLVNTFTSYFRNLREKLFGSIMKQEMGFFDKTRTGELINRLSTDTSLVGQSVTQNISDGLRSLAQAIGGVGMMVIYSLLIHLKSFSLF